MPENWSREEVEATVSDYFEMLSLELHQQPFNKADHNRKLQRILFHRTKGSIERKHQNISAVMIDLGWPYVDGYKPLKNYQALLRDVIEERLAIDSRLDFAASEIVNETIHAVPQIPDILAIQVPVPKQEQYGPALYDSPARTSRAVRRDYLALEARNRSLGSAGEKFILEYEHERLWRAGKRELASRIEHTAETKGDGLGYDIVSFETDGRERLIEVKTTRFGIGTPFYATKNEVNYSQMREKEYHLYRLFSFVKQPKLFILDGSIRETCLLDPAVFSAAPR
jgi:hypothetical protein